MKLIYDGEELSLSYVANERGVSVANIVYMIRNAEPGNKITIDGFDYIFKHSLKPPKKHKTQKIEITDRVYKNEDPITNARLQKVYNYKGKNYTTNDFADMLKVSTTTISTKMRLLASFKLNGEPVKVNMERIGKKYDISKDGEWIRRITMMEAQEYTGHNYKTLSYHCTKKTYTLTGWKIIEHKEK